MASKRGQPSSYVPMSYPLQRERQAQLLRLRIEGFLIGIVSGAILLVLVALSIVVVGILAHVF